MRNIIWQSLGLDFVNFNGCEKLQQIIQYNFKFIMASVTNWLEMDGQTQINKVIYSALPGSWPSHFAKNKINCTNGPVLLLIFWIDKK